MNDLRFCEWIRQESEATSGPGAVHQRLIEATDRLAAAAVEIERLRAIVDKLPKTEDGVPVVPGLGTWTVYNSGRVVSGFDTQDGKLKVLYFSDDGFDKCVWAHYSTPQAAAEAAGGNNGTCHPETGEPK